MTNLPLKTDFPEFVGRIFTYKGEEVMVVDCNYYIGITFVKADDVTKERLCLNRKNFLMVTYPNDPDDSRSYRLPHWKRAYGLLFWHIVAGIHAGDLTDTAWFTDHLINDTCKHNDPHGNSQSHCAFK